MFLVSLALSSARACPRFLAMILKIPHFKDSLFWRFLFLKIDHVSENTL